MRFRDSFLDDALVKHGIHHLHKPDNVGAVQIVAGGSVSLGSFQAGSVDFFHNNFEPLIHFLREPVETLAVLNHLQP